MPSWFDVTRLVTVLNLLLLCTLNSIWLRNHRTLRTRFTLGFLLFGALLLVESGFAFYLFVLNPTTSDWFTGIPTRYNLAIMVLTLLQFGALGVLSWVTLE